MGPEGAKCPQGPSPSPSPLSGPGGTAASSGLGMLTPLASTCPHVFPLRWEDLSETDETITELRIGSSWEFELPKAQVK